MRRLNLLSVLALTACSGGLTSTLDKEAGTATPATDVGTLPETTPEPTEPTEPTEDTGTTDTGTTVTPTTDTGLTDTGTTAPITDLDGDGFDGTVDDCDDLDPAVNPDGRDVCDTVDNDCDGVIDPHCHDPSTATTFIEGTGGFDGGRMVAADLDGDGDTEVAIGTVFSERVSVFVDAPAAAAAVTTDDAEVVLYGGSFLECFGCSIDAADLTGDGAAELLVGAPFVDVDGTDRGVTYVMGGVTSLPSFGGPSDATATITGEAGFLNMATYHAGSGGDPTDDGIADLLMTSSDIIASASRTWVIPGPFTGTVDASTAILTVDEAATGDSMGTAILVADVTGDGIDDAIIGNPGGDEVLVFAGPVSGTLDTAQADHVLWANAGDELGARLTAADFDGDGNLDLAIGAPGANGGDGAILVAPGPILADLDLRLGALATIASTDPGAVVGHEEFGLTHADFDGDGIEDLVVGVPWSGAGGVVGVFFGPNVDGDLRVELADMLIEGALGDLAGTALGAGDVDGDSIPDLWVGVPGYSANTGGVRVYSGATL